MGELPEARGITVGRHRIPPAARERLLMPGGFRRRTRCFSTHFVAQESDGDLIVGRGVPAGWLKTGDTVSVDNFPTINNQRLSMRITTSGREVTLDLGGRLPSGSILFELPSFVKNIASSSSGTIDQQSGTVTLSTGTNSVTVTLKKAPTG